MLGTRIGLLLLCTCCIHMSYAQPKKMRIAGKKCARVELQHPELLMAAHTLTETEIQHLLEAGVKMKAIEDILQFSQEINWPEQTRNLQARISHPDSMQAYVLYDVAAIKNWHLLCAPVKYNRKLSPGWALPNTIYFIVQEKALVP